MIQERVDRLPSASQADFSPDGHGGGVAGQGKSRRASADRRRRD
jgi:hypothetical protein